MINSKIHAAITDVLKRYPVKLAYLYGSQAKDIADSTSDLDIAVVPQENHQLNVIKLAADIDQAAPGIEIDTQVINIDKSPLLAFNAVRLEQPIYAPNEPDRIAFERRIIKDHFDNERLYRIKQQYRDQQLL